MPRSSPTNNNLSLLFFLKPRPITSPNSQAISLKKNRFLRLAAFFLVIHWLYIGSIHPLSFLSQGLDLHFKPISNLFISFNNTAAFSAINPSKIQPLSQSVTHNSSCWLAGWLPPFFFIRKSKPNTFRTLQYFPFLFFNSPSSSWVYSLCAFFAIEGEGFSSPSSSFLLCFFTSPFVV